MITIDVDMPENCESCFLFDGEYSRCQVTHERTKTFEEKYAPNCPIINHDKPEKIKKD